MLKKSTSWNPADKSNLENLSSALAVGGPGTASTAHAPPLSSTMLMLKSLSRALEQALICQNQDQFFKDT